VDDQLSDNAGKVTDKDESTANLTQEQSREEQPTNEDRLAQQALQNRDIQPPQEDLQETEVTANQDEETIVIYEQPAADNDAAQLSAENGETVDSDAVKLATKGESDTFEAPVVRPSATHFESDDVNIEDEDESSMWTSATMPVMIVSFCSIALLYYYVRSRTRSRFVGSQGFAGTAAAAPRYSPLPTNIPPNKPQEPNIPTPAREWTQNDNWQDTKW